MGERRLGGEGRGEEREERGWESVQNSGEALGPEEKNCTVEQHSSTTVNS